MLTDCRAAKASAASHPDRRRDERDAGGFEGLSIVAAMAAFDKIPLGPYMFHISELRGTVPQRPAVAGLIYMHLRTVREIADGRKASQSKARMGKASEHAKGRRWEHSPRLSPAERLSIGLQLLNTKARLPHGHFGPWLEANAPVSAHLAHQCMKLAREAQPADEAQVKFRRAA